MPILSKLARKVLCIPAASSKSERVFSLAGNTISKKCTRLSATTARDLVVISSNLNLLKEFTDVQFPSSDCEEE